MNDSLSSKRSQLLGRWLRPMLGMVASLGLSAAAAGCGDDSAVSGGGGQGVGGTGAGVTGGTDPTGGSTPSDVCLLHNCREDAHCAGCSDGRTGCLIEDGGLSGRCVACGPGGQGCPEGQECSSFGQCVDEGLTCPVDAEGAPTISCLNSGDCAACDPAHQVCDPASHLCVACTENDTSECQSTDVCRDGVCGPACTNECEDANDCSRCPGAKACNNHKCSECSETYACPAGEFCNLSTGTCEVPCGLVEAPGTCITDEDCAGCLGTTECKKPLNADPTDPGTCGANAGGCSDLGEGVLQLPPPYNQVTDTCSDDGDCAGVGIQYNVGEALRDLIGADDILGQPIGDANVEYPMDVCAAVSLSELSCGVCVPCRVDADCQDIPLDGLTGQLFPGVGSIVLAVLFDQLFGPEEHNLYMYCESVAAGYGVCTPCPGLLNDCATDGPIDGGGKCDHSELEVGTALDPECNDCAAIVCQSDSFCCENEWDQLCVDQGVEQCGDSQCHDECVSGTPMGAECGSCAEAVCEADPYCCTDAWDQYCIDGVSSACGFACDAQ